LSQSAIILSGILSSSLYVYISLNINYTGKGGCLAILKFSKSYF